MCRLLHNYRYRLIGSQSFADWKATDCDLEGARGRRNPRAGTTAGDVREKRSDHNPVGKRSAAFASQVIDAGEDQLPEIWDTCVPFSRENNRDTNA